MIYIITVVLAIGVCVLSLRLFLLTKSMKDAGEQLREINKNLEENRIVRLSAPNQALEELLTDINAFLQAVRQQRIVYDKREKAFKQQIEHISHDLRTPLTSMIGYLRIMDTGRLSVEEQEDLQTVIRKAGKLQELISQFYDYSRLTDSEYVMEPEVVQVDKLLREALVDSYGDLSARQLEVEVDIPEQPIAIIANQNALQRVFQNLLQNVIRYAVSTLEVSVREEQDMIVICFANDVENLNEHDVEHLFERFYTVDKARSNGSTGLGLTIAKEFVEKMEGKLEARLDKDKLCVRMLFGRRV